MALSVGSESALDTTVTLVTPERIVFEYPLAGPFCRYFAYLLDFLISLGAVMVIAMIIFVASLGTSSGIGPILVAYFVIWWGYRGFCEAVFNGQTIGKRIVGIRVISVRGVPITAAQAVLRNLVGCLDGTVPYVFRPDITSMLLLFGLTSMLLTKRFQRLGDLAAGTMVVVEQRRLRGGVVDVSDPAVAMLLPWLPLRIAAGTQMARALSDYVKRRKVFPRSLREEMAEALAAPLRKKYGLPANASADAVVCAVYHRVFRGE